MSAGEGPDRVTARRGPSRSTRSNDDNMGASVGQNVRRERERAGLSVREFARRLGVSASFLSQFELGQSQAAVTTLFAMASELNVSLDDLLGHSVDRSRTATGAKPEHPSATEILSFRTGIRWKRLAAIDGDHIDFLLTEYEPGADSAPDQSSQQHRGNDYGYVLEGTLTVIVKGRRRRVTAGKAIAMRGDVPHRLINETDSLVRAIWFVTE